MSDRVLRVGVIGCGGIAQTMHLPYLKRLPMFEIGAMCDISQGQVDAVADLYGVERRFTDYRRLLELRDLDAVFVATRDHPPVAIDAANAGKHVMTEKPIAFNLEDADQVIAAARRNRVKLMIAYMKRYDPGYQWAQQAFKSVGQVHLVRLHDFGGTFSLYPQFLDIVRAGEIPASVARADEEKATADLVKAIGPERAHLAKTYNSLLHLCTHDATILRGAFGSPEKVLFADVRGQFMNAVLRFPDGTRCVWESGLIQETTPWDESLTVYGSERTVKVQFPYPWLHNAPTMVTVTQREDGAFVEKSVAAGFDEAFRREWKHFYECVTEDKEPVTNGEEARADVAMLIDMVKAVPVEG